MTPGRSRFSVLSPNFNCAANSDDKFIAAKSEGLEGANVVFTIVRSRNRSRNFVKSSTSAGTGELANAAMISGCIEIVTLYRNVERKSTRRVTASRALSVITDALSGVNDGGLVSETTVLNGTTGISSFGSRRFMNVITDVTTSPVSESTIRIVSGYTPSNGIDNAAPCLSLVLMGTTAMR